MNILKLNSPQRGNIYMLAVLVNMLVMSFAISYFMPMLEKWAYPQATLAILAQALSFLPPFILYLLITRSRLGDVIPLAGVNATNCGLIILMCLTLQPAMALLSAASTIFFENNISMYLFDMFGMPFPVVLLAMSVTPSILEEITLRGVIFKNYDAFPIRRAALANGLLFGIIHLDPQQFLYAFMMGIIFCYFVHYTRSIFASMLAHFCINTSQSILGAIGYGTMENLPPEMIAMAMEPSLHEYIYTGIFLAIVTAIFLPVFIIIFRSFVTYNKHRLLREALSAEEASGKPLPAVDLAASEAPVNRGARFELPPLKLQKKPPAPNMFNWAFWCIAAFYVFYVVASLL